MHSPRRHGKQLAYPQGSQSLQLSPALPAERRARRPGGLLPRDRHSRAEGGPLGVCPTLRNALAQTDPLPNAAHAESTAARVRRCRSREEA
jgi:hypothetical protein